MLKARFATPPFQERFRALAASGQLPPAEEVQKYQAHTEAWRNGQADASLAALRQSATGPWAATLQRELARRQAVLAQFAALQQARGAAGYAEQLLAFRLALDAEEDVHFARATQADFDQNRGQVLAQAQAAMNRAARTWPGLSQPGRDRSLAARRDRDFRSVPRQARLLAEASSARSRPCRCMRSWARQRRRIRPPSMATSGRRPSSSAAPCASCGVLDPELVKSKLALRDASDDARIIALSP